jgi:hypothetical protein
MKLTTTLAKIRTCSPRGLNPHSDGTLTGYLKLRSFVGDSYDPDAEINLLTILESNGVADMLSCLRATYQDSRKIASQLAIEFAELSLCYFEKKYPNDKRPREAIQAARDFNAGKIKIAVLREKRDASYAAAVYATYAYAAAAAAAAYAAAYAAADAAYADAVYDAAADTAAAAYAAIYDAAADASAAYAAYAADASAAAAVYAAADAAAAAAAAAYAAADAKQKMREKQAEIIRMILEK